MVRQASTIIAQAIRVMRYQGETTLTTADLLKFFLMAGYGEPAAKKWIGSYVDLGLLSIDKYGRIDISAFPTVI